MNLFVLGEMIQKVKNKPFFWDGRQWVNAVDNRDTLTSQAYDFIIETLEQHRIFAPDFKLPIRR